MHVEELVSHVTQQRGGLRASVYEAVMPDILPNPSSGWSVSSYLYSVFPSPRVAVTILDRGKFLLQPGRMLLAGTEQLIAASERPSASAHPAQFAYKLLQLALCLQELEDTVLDATRYVEIVSRHVTSKDMLVDSFDGLKSLILEATFHINDNNVRAAWLLCRRALSIAQLIGLDQLKGEDRAKAIWFRLICADRYLSLILGLPLAVADNNFTNLRGDAEGQLEYIHAILLGRIITRNVRMQQLSQTEYEETQDIDYSLRQAARSFPTSWWIVRSLNNIAEEEVMEVTRRLTMQMHHYYFIIVLHQPYLLHVLRFPTTRDDSSYGKMSIPLASREVLLRFLALRSFHRGVSYRGVDEKAIMAATTLLLAHIDGHRCEKLNFLEHQRPQDLNIINDFLDLIENLSVANSATQNVKKLLKIESEVANGANYAWTDAGGVDLEFKIPYFGTMCPVLMNPQGELPHRDESLRLDSSSLDAMTFDLTAVIGDLPSFEEGSVAYEWDEAAVADT